MTPCIESTYAKNAQGQPQIWLKGKTTNHSRIVFCQANGVSLESIADKVVRHTCDNQACINPEHLELGTQQDNMDDKMQRGRWKGGRPAVLTAEQCEEIRRDFRQHRTIAKDYGVSHSVIGAVKNRTGVYK